VTIDRCAPALRLNLAVRFFSNAMYGPFSEDKKASSERDTGANLHEVTNTVSSLWNRRLFIVSALWKFHLRDSQHLDAILDALIGNAEHRAALVSFDSKPQLAGDFTPKTGEVAQQLANLDKGDSGANILEAVFRRAILLL
jgi:hypothetical protein